MTRADGLGPPPPQWALDMIVASSGKRTRSAITALADVPITHTDEPPVRLHGESLQRWHGELVVPKPDGTTDRSASLVEIGRTLHRVGATRRTILEAVAERDVALFNKYTDRTDAADRYVELVDQYVLSLEGAASEPEERSSGTPANANERVGNEEARLLAAIPEYPMDALPEAMHELVTTGYQAGLPRALVAGAALGALAAAVGAQATLTVVPGWTERAILWLALLGPRGAGKSPAQQLAFAPLREHDRATWPTYREQLAAFTADKNQAERPVDPTILAGDTTLEALARRLASTSALPLLLDELSVLVRGLGEYKRGQGGDRGRFLELWTGDDWRYTRVGASSSRGANSIDLLIVAPTLVICGGLQPRLHTLLGGEDDGMRPRWLPHLAVMPTHVSAGHGTIVACWRTLIDKLVSLRERPRAWHLDPDARRRFFDWQRHWKTQAQHTDENASTSAALIKADIHLMRVALVLAEAYLPGEGGEIPTEIVDDAARIVSFTLDCWRALPEAEGLSLSRRDEVLDAAVVRLVDWLEQHGGQANRRLLLKNNAAGVKTARDLDQLLERYQETYPGTVVTGPSTGGRPPVLVSAPKRGESTLLFPTFFGTEQTEEIISSHRNGHSEIGSSTSDAVEGRLSGSDKVVTPNKGPDKGPTSAAVDP